MCLHIASNLLKILSLPNALLAPDATGAQGKLGCFLLSSVAAPSARTLKRRRSQNTSCQSCSCAGSA